MSHDYLGNIGYVRRLWKAFESGGVSAMTALLPPDVVWRPLAAEGRVLRGIEELQDFWSSREVVTPTLRMFHGHGDDVLVEAEYTHQEGHVRTVWSVFRFDGEQLLEAASFADEAQARTYSAASALA